MNEDCKYSQALSLSTPNKFAIVMSKDVTVVARTLSKVVPAALQVSTTYRPIGPIN